MIGDHRTARILALAAVLTPESDPEYFLRRVFRWYSREFHTPLHEVERLPIDDVFQHYYECRWEDDLEKLETPQGELVRRDIDELLLEEDEATALEEAKAAEEAELDEIIHIKNEQEAKKAQKRAAKQAKKDAPVPIEEKPAVKGEPLVVVQHITEAEMEALLAQDPVKQPPKKR